MKKLLFFVCALYALVACNDVEPIPVSEAVLISFEARFPEAQHITWGSAGNYLVAEFYLDNEGVKEECAAWFSPTGEWQMTEREMSYSSLPAAVRISFEAGEYATWVVDDVAKIERLSSVEYLIVADGFYLGVPSEAYLYFTEAGSLVRGVIDPDQAYWMYLLE